MLLQTGEYDILENQLSSFSKDEKSHPAVMELQADFLMARGKNAEALAVYDQMLKKTAEEGKSSVLLKKAMAAMRTGKNDVAVKTLDEALTQDPANVHAVKMYLLTANQTEAAKRVVSRAAEAGAPPILTDLFGHLLTRKNWNFEKMAISGIQSSRPGPGMYHETARAYLALGESDKAMAILAEGYKLYPADSTLLEIQFDQALALKDEKAIAKILETARDKNADGVHGLYFQAIYLASQGQTAEARSLSSDIARKVPSHNGNQLLLAKLDIEVQDFTAAKNRLERAISADPSFAPALSLLSDLEFREGQDEAALNYIKRALTQDPQNAVYLAQFLSIQQAKLPAQNVLEIRKKIAEAAPDFTQNTQELSLMFLDQGRIEEALQTARIDTITDKSPFSQRAFKAQVLAATGKTKEALSLYESLSKESPDKTDIAARHTFLLIMNGDFDAALTRIATTRKSARRDDILLVEESLAHQNKALNSRNRPEALKSLEAAITVLSRHVTLHASDARNHLQLARLKIAAGYPVDAVQPDIDRAIQANPSFPEAVILKSELDFQKGATSQAIEVLRAAIQSNPDHRGYYLRLHDYYRATGQSRHSQQALDEAIRRFPNDADLHTQRMLHHLSVDELSPAVKDAERAFTLSPTPGTLANYAQANLRAGNRPLARKIMAEHQPLVDSSPVLLSLQARMLAEDGDLSAATGILQRLFEENQHEGTARMILENARQAIGAEATEKILASTKSKLPPETQKILHIQFLLQSGQIPKAAQILSDYPFSALKDRLNILIPLVLQTTQALPLSDSDTLLQKYSSAAPDNPILLFARARNRAAAGDMPSAKNLIAEAEKSAPREARLALIELLLAQMAQSKDDATRDRIGYETNLQLDHLMRAYPDDPNLPLLKAAYLIENKKLKEAAEAAETILKNDPASSRAAIMLSRIRMEQGEKMKAVGEAEFFLSRFPQDITVRRHLAAILREVDQRKFNDFLNSSLRLFPADTVLLTFKAEIESEKNKPAAIEYYKKALFQNPTNPLLLNNLAYLQSQTKDLNDALANALKAKELAPQDPYILDTLGRIQFLKGDLKSAQETLERSLFFKPLPDACLHLAELHIRAGDKARAREYLNQAKSLAGDEKNHLEKIASLEKEL
ncbi:tetratricopeptide repeat protein [Oscillatoria amoena NRMC-F 0135]|nr:tetratricopeptide repeat protein [Oscillatoria amoena NRMC-F 0135]